MLEVYNIIGYVDSYVVAIYEDHFDEIRVCNPTDSGNLVIWFGAGSAHWSDSITHAQAIKEAMKILVQWQTRNRTITP